MGMPPVFHNKLDCGFGWVHSFIMLRIHHSYLIKRPIITVRHEYKIVYNGFSTSFFSPWAIHMLNYVKLLIWIHLYIYGMSLTEVNYVWLGCILYPIIDLNLIGNFGLNYIYCLIFLILMVLQFFIKYFIKSFLFLFFFVFLFLQGRNIYNPFLIQLMINAIIFNTLYNIF